MKKLLLLLIIPFFLSGCYDYNELSELAIVSGIGIDYTENNFIVTYEILSTKKESDSSGSTSAYTVTSKGKTISEAFSNNGNHLDKVTFFDHIDIVVINEEIAQNHLQEITEFMIRATDVRNEFYMVIAKNKSAKEIISNTTKEKPSSAVFIKSLLENNKDTSSAAYYDLFTDTVSKILTPGKDAMLPIITLVDKDITLNGLGVFKDFNLVGTFTNNEAAKINLLSNFTYDTVFFKQKCPNGSTVINIYDGNVQINPTKEEVFIEAKLSGKVVEDTCGIDFRKEETYLELEKDFSQILQKELDEVIKKLKTYQSNALNIGKTYYSKTRNTAYFKWLNQDFKYKLNLKINRKGLIFQVN